MDDFDSFLDPSGDQNASLDSLDWNFLTDTGAHPDINALDGAGVDCELKRFDSVYNSRGDKIILEAGSKRNITVNAGRAFSSALVLTKYWTEDKSIRLKELEIKSPHMKAALKAVVPFYKDFRVHLKHIVIRDDPQCLFHFRDELQNYGENLQDQTAARHVLFLLKYMWWDLSTQISTYYSNTNVNKGDESLDQESLWMAFRPGDLVYVPAKGHQDEQIYRFISMERIGVDIFSPFGTRWRVILHCITSDGTKFGEDATFLSIKSFEGLRQLRSLPIFPLKYHPEASHIQARLLDRGKKFCSLHGSHYRQYNGVAELLGENRNLTILGEDDSFPTRSTMVCGRVIIDTKAFHEARPGEEMYISSSRKSFDAEQGEHLQMDDDEYLICSNRVAGYSLHDKKWGYFRVDLIAMVDFNQTAFDSLILDSQLKQQILSLVQVHSCEELKFDDVIRGKGKGMVFLLHGEPGVGKTLTAESVADYSRRPLLRLDATSLGTTAESVESSLSSVFRFSERWRAVALLDEADVFLNQRDATNLEHNSLVSVFLRVLEYYEGIIFLTTNRIGVFDQAFKSRVHLAIYYPKLSETSRKTLWYLFLSHSSVESAEALKANGTLDRIAGEELNGRQIKNVVRSAHSLAFSENSLIQSRHVTMALKPIKAFEKDFENGVREVGQRRATSDLGEAQEPALKRRRN